MVVSPGRVKWGGLTAGALWVALLSTLTLAAAVLVTSCWWDFMVAGDTPTNVFRNVGFLAAGIVALVFAFWRGVIAKEQATTARLEHLHGRFERALELFAREGIEQSAGRISGLHLLRFLVRDAPGEFAVETVEIVTTFIVQADPRSHDLKEFRVAVMSATYVCDVVDEHALFDEEARGSLRADVGGATELLRQKLRVDGTDPEQFGI